MNSRISSELLCILSGAEWCVILSGAGHTVIRKDNENYMSWMVIKLTFHSFFTHNWSYFDSINTVVDPSVIG